MSHVDDGVLHAYLDGAYPAGSPDRAAIDAHLAECADCRTRLAEARRVRDRAGDILGLGSPSVVGIPDFADVLSRAGQGRAGVPSAQAASPRRRYLVIRNLAWAASVVLALGVGWYARGALLGPAADDLGVVASAQRQPEPTASADEQAGRSAAGPDVETVAPEATSIRTPTDATVAAAEPTPADTDRRTAAGQAAVASAPAQTQVAAAGRAEPPAELQAIPIAPTPPAAARLEAAALAPALSSSPLDRLLEGDARALDAVQWSPVALSAAEERLGLALALPDGLPPIGVAVAELGDVTIIRTTHAAATGTLVELFQWVPLAAPAREPVQARVRAEDVAVGARLDRAAPTVQAPAARRERRVEPAAARYEDGVGVLILERANRTLLVRAPVPLDSLRSLAERIP